MKVIIVGGVAGGAGVAARVRRLDEKAKIIIYDKTNYVSYATCGLPYYIGDVIKEETKLTVQTPMSLKKRFNIDVFVRHEVLSIDKVNKTVSVLNLNTNETFVENYDYLVLATGAKPIILDFCKGKKNIFTVKTVEDATSLKSHLVNNNVKSAVVIGGGYIGVEMAENLSNIGIKTSLVELNNHLLANLDQDMASFVHAKCKEHFDLFLNTEVVDVLENGEGLEVFTKDGGIIKTDIVVCALGVMPNTSLAKDSGLELGIKGSIKVNENLMTSDANIYACGDAIEIKNAISNEDSLISLAGPANKQARIVANNICGIEETYHGAQGSSIIKLFDLTVAQTGLNEVTCKRLGYNFEKIICGPMSHAGYYPGAKPLIIKALLDMDSKQLLGAQIIGADGVDKRIDVLATAINYKAYAPSLKDLDLSYAPPYSSAKDPINLIGCIASNLVNGVVKQFYYEDIEALQKEDVILLDTRTVLEYERGHALGFINIPLDELRERVHELDHTKKVYVMCHSGFRSYVACKILNGYGIDAYNFAGGHMFYSSVHSDLGGR